MACCQAKLVRLNGKQPKWRHNLIKQHDQYTITVHEAYWLQQWTEKKRKENGSKGLRILPALMSVGFLFLCPGWGWDSYHSSAHWVREEDEGKKVSVCGLILAYFMLWKLFLTDMMQILQKKQKTQLGNKRPSYVPGYDWEQDLLISPLITSEVISNIIFAFIWNGFILKFWVSLCVYDAVPGLHAWFFWVLMIWSIRVITLFKKEKEEQEINRKDTEIAFLNCSFFFFTFGHR